MEEQLQKDRQLRQDRETARASSNLLVGLAIAMTVATMSVYLYSDRSESLLAVGLKVVTTFLVGFFFPLVVLFHGTWSILVESRAYWWWSEQPGGPWGVVGTTAAASCFPASFMWLSVRHAERWWAPFMAAVALGAWFAISVLSLGAVTGGA